MKKMILTTVIFFFIVVSAALAQSMGRTYTTALGVKVFDGAGITLKHFVKPNRALEGIAYFWNRGTRITGLYEIHFDIDGAPGLKWYVGPGAHLGFYNSKYKDGDGTFAGIDVC